MSDDKLDKILEHIVELKEAVAEMRGAKLPERVEKLEEHVQKDLQRWAKLGIIGTAASIFGVEVLHTLLKKIGISP